MPHCTNLWWAGDAACARRSRTMAGTSCQRDHRGKSEQRGPTSPTRAGVRPVNKPFLTRIQAYGGNSSTSVAVTSAYRERHAALAQSAILAAGGGLGLWLFRSESFHACVHETFWNESRGMATPPSAYIRIFHGCSPRPREFKSEPDKSVRGVSPNAHKLSKSSEIWRVNPM